MRRAVTAIYRSRETALLVRDELDRFGVGRTHVRILPDADKTVPAASGASVDRAGTATLAPGPAVTPGANFTTKDPGYAGIEPAYADASSGDDLRGLHDLNLPDEDKRTYGQAIRAGNYVVSVDVDDNADISGIQEIMRRPEGAYDLAEAKHRHRRIITDDSHGRTVAALLDSEADAGAAVERLGAAGVPERCISVHPTATEQADLQAYGDQHKRFADSIKHLPLSEEDTQRISEAMTRGAYLVAVDDFDSSLRSTVVDVLDGHGRSELRR